jgi:hypothetical protein
MGEETTITFTSAYDVWCRAVFLEHEMETGLVKYQGEEVFDIDVRPNNLQNIYWRTKEGELIALQDMHDDHLRNTALMLMGMGYQKYFAPERVKVLWLMALRLEWERRRQV